jgi:hypothetical protein
LGSRHCYAFCKQQELIKSVQEINRIISKGDNETYEECAIILRKALDHGDSKDDGMDIFTILNMY